jgi:hypothetical protein
MPFDVFSVRDQVVSEYQRYVKSFINILDSRLSEFVTQELDQGRLWPDPVFQLNPAFECGLDLKTFARKGLSENEPRDAEAIRTGHPYQTCLDPPPGDPRAAHGSPNVGNHAFADGK